MKKGLLILILLGLGLFSFGQKKDTARSRLFAPGTLVGKYYGSYDTTSKKDNLADSTLKIANIQQNKDSSKILSSGQLSGKSQLKSKVVVDPIDNSGTSGVTGIQDATIQPRAGFSSSGITAGGVPNLKANIDPIESSGTSGATGIQDATIQPRADFSNSGITTGGVPNLKANIDPFDTIRTEQSSQIQVNNDIGNNLQAGTISDNRALQKNPNIKPPEIPKSTPGEFYRPTRLGSSSTLYDTYKKNNNGIGAITTSPIKISTSSEEKNLNRLPEPASETARERLRLTLGSSSLQFDTWKKNDYGFGAITNTPNKTGILSASTPEPDSIRPAKKDPRTLLKLRLGSSSSDAITYQENNHGLGKSTTTVKGNE